MPNNFGLLSIAACIRNAAHTLHVDGTLRLRKIYRLFRAGYYVSDPGGRTLAVRRTNESALIKRDRDKISAVEWARHGMRWHYWSVIG